MKVIETLPLLRHTLDRYISYGKTIGFVPTMGALHNGHISLLARARSACDQVVTSIFVNPTQFNNPEDLRRYPRILEKDLELLEAHGCDCVFVPSEEEVYPGEKSVSHWDFGAVSHVLEAHYRPGHFDGVLSVVKRLFEMVTPNKAFFGEKDFQQLALIRHMTAAEALPVQIISCPTVREPDGLAMSSRNLRLEGAQRETATHISRVLFEMNRDKSFLQPAELVARGMQALNAVPGLVPEYLEVVDAASFIALAEWNSPAPVALVAAYVGEVRLIDNVPL